MKGRLRIRGAHYEIEIDRLHQVHAKKSTRDHITHTYKLYIISSAKLNLEGLKTERAREISSRDSQHCITVTVAFAFATSVQRGERRIYDPTIPPPLATVI